MEVVPLAHSGRVVGNPYLGITSRLPVTREPSEVRDGFPAELDCTWSSPCR